ncbi:MAG: caa(3)-type oxidase subunit IV [Verrucomicrobiae bacterium]|nr:caa(3)-type oxidase subunit IV [Verrucomicrobiae bacterium]
MSDHENHSHPNYVKIWGVLLVLLIVSILGPLIGVLAVTLITAFGIAVVKAWMVAQNFMHLKTESKIVPLLLLSMIVLLGTLFFGVASDILNTEGQNWRLLDPDAGAGEAAGHHGGEAGH